MNHISDIDVFNYAKQFKEVIRKEKRMVESRNTGKRWWTWGKTKLHSAL